MNRKSAWGMVFAIVAMAVLAAPRARLPPIYGG